MEKIEPMPPVVKRMYFTKDHEDAIVSYCTAKTKREKEILYETLIGPAFNEMVDKIVFTFKFNTLPNINNLREECKFWLMTILEKYDVNRGKAFGYFSVITKNWFIHKVKKHNKMTAQEISFDGCSREVEKLHTESNNYETDRIGDEFWQRLKNEMKTWDSSLPKQQDEIVLEAIKLIMENKEEIEIFNKKAIYIYIREITGFNSKQITSSLSKIKEKYFEFKGNWNNLDDDNEEF